MFSTLFSVNLKNTGFLKSVFLSLSKDGLCFLFKARQEPFFGGLFGVLWAV